MQVRIVAGGGAARVDDDDARPALIARRHQPAIEDRMTPGRIAADEHGEIGLVDIGT